MKPSEGFSREGFVARKKHHHTIRPPTLAEVRARAERAVQEGRYQHALELAKQVHKEQPTPENQAFLFDVYLGRARQLRGQNYLRDAATVLNAAAPLAEGNPARLVSLAEELALAGDPVRAAALVKQVSDPQAAGRILGHVADAALQKGPAGRNELPPELHADFDRILQAWSLTETQQDDAAREVLQGIGLRSPFLEWKLLLRGLLAYYQQDDARALENWQRLTPDRLPARLAAPLRFSIDSSYRIAQAPEAQAVLQRQSDRLQGNEVVTLLRGLQKAAASEESLARAFRQLDPVLAALRVQAPDVIPRLANCIFWAIVDHGEPEDVLRYHRHFGASPDDPHGDRLRALACERQHVLQEAQEAWERFEQAIAANANAWPGELGTRARALIWYHMGHAAADIPDQEDLKKLPPFLRNHPDRPEPIKPPAPDCFQRAIELAPDLLDAHIELVAYYRRKGQTTKCIQAATRLLERHPDHVPTLELLGDLRLEQGKPAAALTLFEHAVQINPLDKQLRGKVGSAHLFKAREHAELKQFEEARAEYRATLALGERGVDDSSVYCKWAACEYKAGDTARAEELLAQALAQATARLAVAYGMLIEVIRLKLPRPLKTRFDQEFKEALTEPPTVASVLAVAETAASHRRANITYTGQKTHEKQVTTYLDKARNLDYTEAQLERLCQALQALQSVKLLIHLAKQGQRRFPTNPMFFLLEGEAQLAKKTRYPPTYELRLLLRQARPLVEQLPPGDRKEAMQAILLRQELELARLDPWSALESGPFGGLFESMMDDMVDDEMMDDEDDEFF